MALAEKQRREGSEKPTRIQEINRSIILDAALDVFSIYGFRGSTIDQIAEKASMSKPNLLYYFKRKDDIYAGVLEATLDEWLEPLRGMNPDGDPVEELRRYITRKLEMSARKPAASRFFANEILHGAPHIHDFLKTELKQLVDAKSTMVRRWVSEGRLAPVDPYHLFFLIWATTQHYADFDVQIRAVLGDEVDRPGFYEQTTQALLSILLNGVKVR